MKRLALFSLFSFLTLRVQAYAMECNEVLMYASNYQAAMVNCIACNTTSNNLSFADANSICPGVAATWCMKTDPTCSKSGSGCTSAVIACESFKQKPNPSPSPNPNPNPGSKPSSTSPMANSTQPTTTGEQDSPTVGSIPTPTQTPQQVLPEARPVQGGPNGPSYPGSNGGWPLPSVKSQNTLPPTQRPGTPNVQAAKNFKAGQSGHLVDRQDTKSVRGQPSREVARDEFDNPIRSANPSLKNKTIPNNSGGPIPTSETSAQLPPQTPKPAAQSPYRKLGDLSTASLSGGSAPGNVQAASFDDATYKTGDRSPSSTGPGEFQNVNLNSYLPGGANDHRRRLLMGEVLSTGEIHNRTVDLFRRITIRMSEYCANGELLDCR